MSLSKLAEEFLNRLPKDWQDLIAPLQADETWLRLIEGIQARENEARLRLGEQIAPAADRVFRALEKTPVKNVKVVILGQDPYHSPGLAQGLAFSIPESIRLGSRWFPSSLRNISKALVLDGYKGLFHGNLERWAEQGVLLLNATLTVQLGHANAHANWGWQEFTDRLIALLASQNEPIAWFLWGSHAQKKSDLINKHAKHLILTASHPSGLSVYKTSNPFIYPGDTQSCGHFRTANNWLIEQEKSPIAW